MSVSKMGIAEGAADMLSGYLRDNIYADKVLACIRETITNSQDEHIKYGIDRAVEVKLQEVNGQWMWSSRDFAKGLSETSIRTIYGMYGGSDKRNSNLQVGGFGIGALSPFAVSDSFYITSYHEGFKTQYACILGAGQHGVSVGEIYKVSDPEPTNESGLEVSLDVTKNRCDFHNKTTIFVQRFLPDAKIEYCGFDNMVRKPMIPTLSKTINGYVFNLYPEWGGYGDQYLGIRMGGIVYRNTSGIRVNNPKGKIIVDVPIGKMSIPISREDFEDTPSNNKILGEIEDALKILVEEDAAKTTVPQFGSGVLATQYKNCYDGEWFQYTFSQIFPDSYKLWRQLDTIHAGYNHNVVGGKYTIYLIPDIKSYKNWVKRLDAFIAKILPNTQIIWMKNPNYDIVSTNTLDVSDINFVDVKKLGLPKLPKKAGESEYLVYFDGYKKGTYTAEQLDEYVTEQYFSSEEISDGWENKINDISILRRRVIGLSADYGCGNPFWVCNSIKMRDQLVELGWFTPDDPNYKKRFDELKEIERVKKNMEDAEYRVKSVMFRVKPSNRLISIIGKKPEKLAKIEQVRNLLKKEDSFRGRILNSIDTYYPKMTREDLRKILTMK